MFLSSHSIHVFTQWLEYSWVPIRCHSVLSNDSVLAVKKLCSLMGKEDRKEKKKKKSTFTAGCSKYTNSRGMGEGWINFTFKRGRGFIGGAPFGWLSLKAKGMPLGECENSTFGNSLPNTDMLFMKPWQWASFRHCGLPELTQQTTDNLKIDYL